MTEEKGAPGRHYMGFTIDLAGRGDRRIGLGFTSSMAAAHF